MSVSVFDPRKIRDITPEVMEDGKMKVLPASYWKTTTKEDRGLFGHRHAVYGFPTVELIDFVKDFTGDRSVIEIGSGTGFLADALGIQGTDSYMQDNPLVQALYGSTGQPTIKYGKNVVNLNAQEAVKVYKPQVVVAQWVTHLYREDRHQAGGNMFGVNEEELLDSVDAYIFIGNEQVHAGKSIWTRPHMKLTPDWLYSRAQNPTKNFIAIWEK